LVFLLHFYRTEEKGTIIHSQREGGVAQRNKDRFFKQLRLA
jgi:hypothetical protein